MDKERTEIFLWGFGTKDLSVLDDSAMQVGEQALRSMGQVTLQKTWELEKIESMISDRFGSEEGKKQWWSQLDVNLDVELHVV